MDRQKQIDWTRAEQLAILREAVLPPCKARDGRPVRPSTAKAVLRTIDDHGFRPFLTYETIAAESNCKHHTVRRAIEVLQTLGVLCVERRATPSGTTCNHYQIVWSELSILRVDRRRTGEQVPTPGQLVRPGQVPTGVDQLPTGNEQVPTGVDQLPTPGQRSVLSVSKRNEPPPPLTPPRIETVTASENWAAVADSLFAVGVRAVWASISDIRSHGIRATRAHQLIAEWQSLRDPHADAQAVDRERGALRFAFANATPSQLELDPRVCFPTTFVASAKARAAAQRRRRVVERQTVDESNRRQIADAELAEASAKFGPVVDAADLSQRIAWLRAAGNEFLIERLHRDPSSPVVRAALIELVARQSQEPPEETSAWSTADSCPETTVAANPVRVR